MPHGLPDRIGRYELLSLLGVGGFAIVVAAHDPVLDAPVAIKVLSETGAHDPGLRERFLREAQLLRRVQSPHVIGIHDLGALEDDRPYLVMELASGGPLAARIGPTGHAADAEGLTRVAQALAAGLGALHASGIVHRDVKPANLLVVGPMGAATGATQLRRILLEDDERLVVSDLGFAKDTARTSVGPTVLGGTLYYQAPEQTQPGAAIGPAADVFAASAVLWTLLTGQPPRPSPQLAEQLAFLPPQYRELFERGLAYEPLDRHESMTAWLHATVAAISTAGSGIGTLPPPEAGGTCPFKGLASFQQEDAPYFFGRETMVDELVGRLQSRRVLVIGGPSGSGKSSVLRAGLLPALERGALPGSQAWEIALFTPGTDPLDQLAEQLSRLVPDRAPIDADLLRDDPRAAGRLLPHGLRAILAIDQFEELLTLSDEATRQAVLATLAVLSSDQQPSLHVILALRADFYATCARYPWLAQCISDNQMLVGPMRRLELRRAIEGPAQRAGLRLEPGLADAILDDAGDGPGTLPLISHALMETWLRRHGTALTLDGFRAAGGVSGAIAQSAENAYASLDETQRATVRHLFLRLVKPGEGGPDTRRLLQTADIGDDARVHQAIASLATERLLTVDERGVQLVHEALISAWPRLQNWLDDARDDLRTEQRLAAAAREWSRLDGDADLLLRGGPLLAARDWRQRQRGPVEDGVARFLAASDEARATEERRSAAEERRRRRVRRSAFGALSVLALAAASASAVAFGALRQSRANEDEAQRRFVGAIATQAASLAHDDPRLALALAVESAARVDPIDPEAQDAMVTARDALASSYVVAAGSPVAVGDAPTVTMSPRGDRFVTGGRDGSLTVWSTETREVEQRLDPQDGGIEEAAIDPSGRWLIAVGRFGVHRWDLDGGDSSGQVIAATDAPVWSVAFDDDGARFAIAAEDGTVQQFDTNSGEPIGLPLDAGADALSVTFLPGDRLGAGTGTGKVLIWPTAGGEPSRRSRRTAPTMCGSWWLPLGGTTIAS